MRQHSGELKLAARSMGADECEIHGDVAHAKVAWGWVAVPEFSGLETP